VRLWVLTNGYGEDRAGAAVARELLARRADLRLVAATLVTPGAEFSRYGIPVERAGAAPRSGGFPAAGLRTAIDDLHAVPGYFAFLRHLHRSANKDDQFLAVGDVFLTGLARLGFGKRGLHVALAKSVYGCPHSALECVLLKRWTRLVFARDAATAAHLQAKRVRAVFAGNPLVDRAPARTTTVPGASSANLPATFAGRVVLLPGSRTEAPRNLLKLLDVVLGVREPAEWHCAWPPAIEMDRGMEAAVAAGWRASGNVLEREGRTVTMSAEGFESLLDEADVVVGLAGTANELAAAAGKPVVTCVGCGPQTTAARMREQERLLSGAAQFVVGDARAVAGAVARLIGDPGERARRGALGIARLGPRGGAGRIADAVIEELSG
jgi:uncharacterized protein (TIGR03492 family)